MIKEKIKKSIKKRNFNWKINLFATTYNTVCLTIFYEKNLLKGIWIINFGI